MATEQQLLYLARLKEVQSPDLARELRDKLHELGSIIETLQHRSIFVDLTVHSDDGTSTSVFRCSGEFVARIKHESEF
jgi:hypothetical protein